MESKRNLLYVSYGTGPHVAEAIYSIQSAIRCTKPGWQDRCRIIVYTDRPDDFAGLEVTIERIQPDEMVEWAGTKGFGHRRKIIAFTKVLEKYQVPTVMVDADTYFLRSPEQLLARVDPKNSVMHINEGKIGFLVAMGYMRNRLPGLKFDLSNGDHYELTADSVVWNSGVVGLALENVGLLAEVLELSDAIHDASPSWISEQQAFTTVLDRKTKLRDCRDILFHYHEAFIRDPFRARLPALLEQVAALPPQQRRAALYEARPKPPLMKKWKAALKRILKPFGFFGYDLQTST